MKSEVNSHRSEISFRFEKSFNLHGNFTTANLFSQPTSHLICLHSNVIAATF